MRREQTSTYILIGLFLAFLGIVAILWLDDWRRSMLSPLTPLPTRVPPTAEPAEFLAERDSQFAVCRDEVNKAYKIKNIRWPQQLSYSKPDDYYYIVAKKQDSSWTFKGQIQASYIKSNGVAVVTVDCEVGNGKMIRFILDPATPRAGASP